MGHTIDWGLTRYKAAWEQQLSLVEKVRTGQSPETLVFTEHFPVITLGARKGAEKHLLLDESQLRATGIERVQSNRGGDITYHGPGQIVGYPIMRLDKRGRDLHAYLRDLEEVLIKTLREFSINVGRRHGLTGIWVEKRKIAAMGIAVKGWTTYHGFALNLDTNLSAFQHIIPCGITDGSVTSMQQELPNAPLPGTVKARLSLEFWKHFGNLD